MEQYHPRRKRNEILDQHEIDNLLNESNHITLALCRDNVPYIVTMSYGLDREKNCLYFHCANKGDKLDVIAANSTVCATIVKDNGYLAGRCDHDYESLIIRGHISIVLDLNEKKHGLHILLNHLENDPEPILKRNIKDDRSYDGVTILRLQMDSVIGKKYRG